MTAPDGLTRWHWVLPVGGRAFYAWLARTGPLYAAGAQTSWGTSGRVRGSVTVVGQPEPEDLGYLAIQGGIDGLKYDAIFPTTLYLYYTPPGQPELIDPVYISLCVMNESHEPPQLEVEIKCFAREFARPGCEHNQLIAEGLAALITKTWGKEPAYRTPSEPRDVSETLPDSLVIPYIDPIADEAFNLKYNNGKTWQQVTDMMNEKYELMYSIETYEHKGRMHPSYLTPKARKDKKA